MPKMFHREKTLRTAQLVKQKQNELERMKSFLYHLYF